MAKKTALNSLMQWGVAGGVTYIGYIKARAGDFGPEAKQLADEIHKALGGLGMKWEPPSGAPPSGAPKSAPPAGRPDTSFIPGVRYVAPYGNGFMVVINGQQVGSWFATQAEAEQAYNRALGA